MLLSDSVSTYKNAHGTGSPEGVVTRGVGAVYYQTDASPTSATTWIKVTGTGNTGWIRQIDAELLALAGLTSVADAIPYFTGSGTAALLTRDTDGTLAANSDTVLATQKAIKTYVDAKVAGLSWKQAVRAATTAALTLASDFENGDTIDGVTLATGDRILIKNQAAPAENGIYTVNASGAPTRATDADAGSELVNATVYVSEGTTLADTQWTCTTNATITPGSTSLAFAQITSGGASTLDSLTDVTAPSPAAGNVLAWNGSAWVNKALTIYLTGDGSAITTLADIPTLELAVGANEVWEVEWGLVCNMTSTSGTKFRWTADGGNISFISFFGLTSGSTVMRMDTLGEVTDSIAYNTFTGSNALTTVKGIYINGGSPTTLKLRATGQGATACTVKKGSWMRAIRVA